MFQNVFFCYILTQNLMPYFCDNVTIFDTLWGKKYQLNFAKNVMVLHFFRNFIDTS